VTPLLHGMLYWQHISQRIVYNLSLTVYRALHLYSTKYIRELVVPVSPNALEQKSAHAVLVTLFFEPMLTLFLCAHEYVKTIVNS